MKSRESVVRLKLFQVREKRRQISQLMMMANEFERMVNELEVQINLEEKKTGIVDINHFAYSTFARSARQRRENLVTSLDDLSVQKKAAEIALLEAEAELSRAQALDERDGISINEDDIVFVQSRSLIG